jgi:pimeloyl-ACP methyl ester carboxylesterase
VRRRLVTILLILLCVYAALVAVMAALQTRMLFPGSGPGHALPAAAEPLSLRTPDGVMLQGVHLPPSHATEAAPVVLGFGGNAWDAGELALFLHDLYPTADIISFHYRGYGPSGGRPGAAALAADSLLEYDLVARRFADRPVVVAGFSIGSGIASWVAPRRSVAGAILVTPFDSLASVVADDYRWLPVRLLFRHRLEPAKDLAGSHVPVAIIAAGSDRLVPPPRSAALRAAVPNLVFDRTIAGADHNSIYAHPSFPAAMREALAAVAGHMEVPARP